MEIRMRAYRWGLVPAAIVLTAALGLPAQKSPPAPIDKDKVMRLFAEEFVLLTPGKGKFPASFRMGSTGDAPDTEKPAVTVTFAAPFAVARYEVTQELYEAVMGTNPSRWKGPRNSVEMVSWEEANEFCRKVTAELRRRQLLAEGEVIRLPSEAEWEYACRAGTTSRYSFGDGADDLKDYAWFKGNSKGEDPPVGKKKPNAWGLYDMHGYVWEWCADAWHPSHEGVPTDGRPRIGKDVKDHVLRGGSWADDADSARSAYRYHKPLDHRSDTIGFRCVKAAISMEKEKEKDR
jgi:formylglycine-generating enzyme required for sulfatase activity